jgi:alpha-ketoglutarate-dependent 2,4-dichlorophenoxyacetate dioxygenase
MALSIEPILPRFGAELSGVDPTRPLDEETREAIRQAQYEWGVTVWRDTGLDDESHVAFSRMFGELFSAPSMLAKSRFALPEIFDAGNLDRQGEIVTDERTRLFKRGDRLWHTDTSFMAQKSGWSLLRCVEAPPEGGVTWFADSRSAYDDLPQATKDGLEGLEAEHVHAWSRRRAGMAYTEEEIDAMPGVRQPLVLTHPITGRKTLYVGSHARDIVGMDRTEGRALIDELIAWTTQPRYVFSIAYQPGDMSIWDNLASLHRGGDFDDVNHRRDMRRTTVKSPPGTHVGTVREPIAA